MVAEPKPVHPIKSIDADDEPTLRAIVERVRETGERQVIQLAGRSAAIIVPVPADEPETTEERPRRWSEERVAALLSHAGAWRDHIDADAFLEANRQSRDFEWPTEPD